MNRWAAKSASGAAAIVVLAVAPAALGASEPPPTETPAAATLCDAPSCGDAQKPVVAVTTDQLPAAPLRENQQQAQYTLYALLAVVAVTIPVVVAWQRKVEKERRRAGIRRI